MTVTLHDYEDPELVAAAERIAHGDYCPTCGAFQHAKCPHCKNGWLHVYADDTRIHIGECFDRKSKPRKMKNKGKARSGERGCATCINVLWVTLVLVVALVMLAAADATPAKGEPTTTTSTVVLGDAVQVTSTITEDDPRWDCHTMGNRVCGGELSELPHTN